MKKILVAAFAISILLSVAASPGRAQAQSPEQTLNQYIADLRKNPNDFVLREKIIRHVQTMKPAPAIPEEAERRMARGGAAVRGAKTEKDFQDAAAEFEKASLAAPWLPAVYYNLGIAQDKAGKYKEAIRNLKLYLLAAPDAPDAKAVRNLVYEIEYRQEKAAKESSPQAVAAKQRDQAEELFRRIVGARYVWHVNWGEYETTYSVDIHGDKIDFGNTPTKISDYRNVPQDVSLGVYKVQWPCPITNKRMQGNDLVIEVGGCSAMQGYTVRNNGGSLTLISNMYNKGYWHNAVFMRSR